jgi:hypothetical protein
MILLLHGINQLILKVNLGVCNFLEELLPFFDLTAHRIYFCVAILVLLLKLP